MARNKAKLSRQNKRWQHQRDTQRQNDVVQHSAAVLTGAAETAGDFAYLCTAAIEELDLDLSYLRVALEIWREQPSPSTQTLVAALDDLLTERLRNREALHRIAQQLEHLKADPSLHVGTSPKSTTDTDVAAAGTPHRRAWYTEPPPPTIWATERRRQTNVRSKLLKVVSDMIKRTRTSLVGRDTRQRALSIPEGTSDHCGHSS